MYNPTDEQLKEIGEIVLTKAQVIFDDCYAADDFGIQHISLESAVLGGTNRIIWTPEGGFKADQSYCTKRFYNEFQKLYGPGRS